MTLLACLTDLLEDTVLSCPQVVLAALLGGRPAARKGPSNQEPIMNPKNRLQSLFSEARDAMHRGDHQLAEGLYWRIMGILRCDAHAPVKLEMDVLEGLAAACEARGKRDDALLARHQIQSLKVEHRLYA